MTPESQQIFEDTCLKAWKDIATAKERLASAEKLLRSLPTVIKVIEREHSK